MNNYSKIERALAYILNRFPFIKNVIKRWYQVINFLIFRQKEKCNSKYRIEKVGQSNDESFFGYYDKSPVNKTEEFIIYHKVTSLDTKKLPDPKLPIYVVLENYKTGKIINEFQVYAYNWQQGSKLMWIDDYQFCFNNFDSESKQFNTIKVDAKKGEIVDTLPIPIYDVHQDFGLSLSFERLNCLRPDYGYRNLGDNNIDLEEYDQDGIFKVNLITNEYDILLSLRSIINFEYKEIFNSAIHKVNHIMISPKGDKFIFLHRYFKNGVKYDRLIMSDKGGSLKVLSDHDMVSHCYWIDNNNIIAFMHRMNIGNKYYIISNINSKVSIELLPNKEMNSLGDGHPSVKNGRVIFDTYPDRSRMKHLYLYDLNSKKLENIAKFLEPLKYVGETRCDLHPKWSFSGNCIFVDSTHEGKRNLYKILLNE